MRISSFLLSIILLLGVSFSYSQNKILNCNPAEQYLKEMGEVYFQIEIEDLKDVYELTSIVSIDRPNGETVKAYANSKQFKKFLQLGYSYKILQHPGTLINPRMMNNVDIKNIEDWDFYPTYNAYLDMMNQFATDYPNLCQVFSIGQTVDGRELMVAKISDNIGVDENEPEFLYTATMHGDETAGYPLMLRLIDYLLSNYGTDARITNIVNGMEIFINPLANPDGTFHGGNNSVNGATRFNANSVDLNRNYPDPVDGPHPDGNNWQSETIAFMDFADEHNFFLSSNLHGGAEVCNYPWDTWCPPHLHADYDWWRLVCHEYADTAQAHSPMGYFTGIQSSGITNGCAWYHITGGRQDYMNYFQHCREFTLELSITKLLPESQLDDHWNYNYRSFLNYIEQAMFGVSGIVTDSETGNPLKAFIEILNHDVDSSHVFSTLPIGNYHRPIYAGTYDIQFSADDHCTKIIENVEVSNYETVVLDIALDNDLNPCTIQAYCYAENPNVTVGNNVQFSDGSLGDIVSWQWFFEGGTPESSTAQNPTVSYSESGTYDVTLIVSDGVEFDTLERQNYINASFQYYMSNGTVTNCTGLFYDDGGLEANYSHNKDYVLTFYPVDDHRNVILDFTSFEVEYHSSCNYDWLKIYDGVNTNASLIGTYCGTDSPGLIEATNPERALTLAFHSDDIGSEFGWEAQIICNPGVNIEEIDNIESHIHIIPNPIDNGLFSVKSEYRILQTSLFSVSGELLQQIRTNQKEFNMNVTQLKAGMYLLQLETDKVTVVKKIQIL